MVWCVPLQLPPLQLLPLQLPPRPQPHAHETLWTVRQARDGTRAHLPRLVAGHEVVLNGQHEVDVEGGPSSERGGLAAEEVVGSDGALVREDAREGLSGGGARDAGAARGSVWEGRVRVC